MRAAVLSQEGARREDFDGYSVGVSDVVLVTKATISIAGIRQRFRQPRTHFGSQWRARQGWAGKRSCLLTANTIITICCDLTSSLSLITRGRSRVFRRRGIGDLQSLFLCRRAGKHGTGGRRGGAVQPTG